VQQELICQGGIQINQNTGEGTGVVSVSVDLPNGPKPGTVWLVDAVGALWADLNSVGLDAPQPSWSGIYMVPVGSNPPSDSIGNINLNSRGLPLCSGGDNNNVPAFFTFFPGPPNNGYGVMAAKGPFIVPAGYTLRAVVSGTDGGVNPMSGQIQLNIYAQLRILQQQ
jgi:hypothetical protein